jgi:hypothetical protein
MHVQLGRSFLISEYRAYAAGFVDSSQNSYQGFWGHCVAVFGSNDDFALVLGAAEEEAECTFDLFLGCEFFYDFVQCFFVVESEDKDSSEFGFSVVQALASFVKKEFRV